MFMHSAYIYTISITIQTFMNHITNLFKASYWIDPHACNHIPCWTSLPLVNTEPTSSLWPPILQDILLRQILLGKFCKSALGINSW